MNKNSNFIRYFITERPYFLLNDMTLLKYKEKSRIMFLLVIIYAIVHS